jgi:hypothetical protein
MIKKNCQICGNEFEAERVDKLTCTPACQKKLQRKNKIDKVDIKKVDKGESGQNVLKPTDKNKISRTGLNYDWNEVSPTLGLRKVPCSGCGEPVWEAGNPCLDCTNKVIELKKKGEQLPNWYQDQTLG